MMMQGFNTENEDAPIMEIIGKSPQWILRWGNVVLFVFILAFAICLTFIKYPEKTTTYATLFACNSSKSVAASQNGRLIKLLVNNNTSVYKNQIIGYFETVADYKQVDSLSARLDSISTFIEDSKYVKAAGFFTGDYSRLGELQDAYNAFIQEFWQFYSCAEGGIYKRKRELLNDQIKKLQFVKQSLFAKKQMRMQDCQLTQKTTDANKVLLDEKVISQQEYRELTSQLINKKINFSDIDDAVLSNRSLQDEKEKEILEIDEQLIARKLSLLKIGKDLINTVKTWKRKNVIYAPLDGLLTYADFLQENQLLQIDQVIAYVSPEQNRYYMKVQIPQTNLGKISIGQNVLLRFPAYRWQEYGTITGQIEYISPVPTDSGYAARIALPETLKTNSNKVIIYREGLLAQAEIITDNTSLLQRFYYSIIR